MKNVIEPESCNSIEEIREAIDYIDQEIIQLFENRQEYVKEIVKFKNGKKEGIIAKERQDLVLKQRKEWAEEKGLDPDMMEAIFRILIAKNIQIQIDINDINNR